jgi:hypothetical protein
MEFLQKIKQLTLSKIKHILVLSGVILLALLGYRFWVHHARKVDQNITNTILQPNEQRKAIIDPIKHKITTVTKDKNGKEITHSTYLPDRPIAIVETNDGKVKIESRKFGPEMRPYLGIGVDNKFRAGLGLDVFYWNKFDLGFGLGIYPSSSLALNDVTANMNISYNIYSHTSLGVSINSQKYPGLVLKVRF